MQYFKSFDQYGFTLGDDVTVGEVNPIHIHMAHGTG
jgi:hypothetical protein